MPVWAFYKSPRSSSRLVISTLACFLETRHSFLIYSLAFFSRTSFWETSLIDFCSCVMFWSCTSCISSRNPLYVFALLIIHSYFTSKASSDYLRQPNSINWSLTVDLSIWNSVCCMKREWLSFVYIFSFIVANWFLKLWIWSANYFFWSWNFWILPKTPTSFRFTLHELLR